MFLFIVKYSHLVLFTLFCSAPTLSLSCLCTLCLYSYIQLSTNVYQASTRLNWKCFWTNSLCTWVETSPRLSLNGVSSFTSFGKSLAEHINSAKLKSLCLVNILHRNVCVCVCFADIFVHCLPLLGWFLS